MWAKYLWVGERRWGGEGRWRSACWRLRYFDGVRGSGSERFDGGGFGAKVGMGTPNGGGIIYSSGELSLC
jgi:hypothetical protein